MAQKTVSKASGKARGLTKSGKKRVASRREKSSSGKPREASKGSSVSDEVVTIDRRRGPRRQEEELPPAGNAAAAPKLERREKVNRRRQIDPTTCERDYTEQEVEFMNALDDYKRKSGRMFPTCSEVLEVLRGLGYVKLSQNELGAFAADTSVASAKPMPSDWQQCADQEALECEAGLTF